MEIIARKEEQKVLEEVFSSPQSELVAVYGRRRVGKTYLIRNFFLQKECIYFELIGQKMENGEIAPMKHQLANFQYAWNKAFKEPIDKMATWNEAFRKLKEKTDSLRKGRRKVILFFDELPWLCSAKSRFYENLDQAWNACFEPALNIKMIVCGSASTWMLKKIVYAKAGLSGRLTGKIHLKPFTLKETAQYLRYRNFDLVPESISEIYMVLGGIPYYLNYMKSRKSLHQNIDDECFKSGGNLREEHDLVFDSLFSNSVEYKRVVSILVKRREGYTFDEILERLNSKAAGAPRSVLHQILTNLYECDFISKRVPVLNLRRGSLYCISDEFTLFSEKWIKPLADRKNLEGAYWQSIVNHASYRSWLGFSFELLCLKHQMQIRKALGLHKISAIPGIFYAYDKQSKKRAAQIDLLFDRADKTITICEIKYHKTKYAITKNELSLLRKKRNALIDYLETKKTSRNILFAYITLHGLKENSRCHELAPDIVTIKDLL